MAKFQVIFEDEYFGLHINHFDDFASAQEYWDFYADAPTCIAGEMIDLDDDEVIWDFGKEFYK